MAVTNMNWYGGNIVAADAGSVVALLRGPKSSGILTNTAAKSLVNCDFVINGTARFINTPGQQQVDLLLNNSRIINSGSLTFGGSVTLQNVPAGAAAGTVLSSDGNFIIEETLNLTQGINLTLAAGNTLLVHVVAAGANATIVPYNVINLEGVFLPDGNFQMAFPVTFKGQWNNVISYTSYVPRAKFQQLKANIPAVKKNHTDTYDLLPTFAATSFSVKVASSSPNKPAHKGLTPGAIFGIVIGSLFLALLLVVLALWLYRRRQTPVEYIGPDYSSINPMTQYGST